MISINHFRLGMEFKGWIFAYVCFCFFLLRFSSYAKRFQLEAISQVIAWPNKVVCHTILWVWSLPPQPNAPHFIHKLTLNKVYAVYSLYSFKIFSLLSFFFVVVYRASFGILIKFSMQIHQKLFVVNNCVVCCCNYHVYTYHKQNAGQKTTHLKKTFLWIIL